MTQPPYGQWQTHQPAHYQQPTYGWYPPPVQLQNGYGTAALVLGLLGLLVPVLGLIAIPLGAVGVGKANQRLATNGGAAAGGIILGLIDIIVAVALYVALVAG